MSFLSGDSDNAIATCLLALLSPASAVDSSTAMAERGCSSHGLCAWEHFAKTTRVQALLTFINL